MMLGRRAKKAKRKRKRVTVVETDELGAGAQVHGAQSLAHGQAQILAQAQGHGIEVLDQAFHRAQAQAQAVAQGMVQPPGQQPAQAQSEAEAEDAADAESAQFVGQYQLDRPLSPYVLQTIERQRAERDAKEVMHASWVETEQAEAARVRVALFAAAQQNKNVAAEQRPCESVEAVRVETEKQAEAPRVAAVQAEAARNQKEAADPAQPSTMLPVGGRPPNSPQEKVQLRLLFEQTVTRWAVAEVGVAPLRWFTREHHRDMRLHFGDVFANLVDVKTFMCSFTYYLEKKDVRVVRLRGKTNRNLFTFTCVEDGRRQFSNCARCNSFIVQFKALGRMEYAQFLSEQPGCKDTWLAGWDGADRLNGECIWVCVKCQLEHDSHCKTVDPYVNKRMGLNNRQALPSIWTTEALSWKLLPEVISRAVAATQNRSLSQHEALKLLEELGNGEIDLRKARAALESANKMQRGVLPPRVPGVAMVDRAQSRRNDSAMLWAYVNMCRAAPYNWLVHVVTKSGSEMRQVLEASVRSFYTTRNRALKAHFGVNATQYSFDVALVRASPQWQGIDPGLQYVYMVCWSNPSFAQSMLRLGRPVTMSDAAGIYNGIGGQYLCRQMLDANHKLVNLVEAYCFGNESQASHDILNEFTKTTLPSWNSPGMTNVSDGQKGQAAAMDATAPHVNNFECSKHKGDAVTRHGNASSGPHYQAGLRCTSIVELEQLSLAWDPTTKKVLGFVAGNPAVTMESWCGIFPAVALARGYRLHGMTTESPVESQNAVLLRKGVRTANSALGVFGGALEVGVIRSQQEKLYFDNLAQADPSTVPGGLVVTPWIWKHRLQPFIVKAQKLIDDGHVAWMFGYDYKVAIQGLVQVVSLCPMHPSLLDHCCDGCRTTQRPCLAIVAARLFHNSRLGGNWNSSGGSRSGSQRRDLTLEPVPLDRIVDPSDTYATWADQMRVPVPQLPTGIIRARADSLVSLDGTSPPVPVLFPPNIPKGIGRNTTRYRYALVTTRGVPRFCSNCEYFTTTHGNRRTCNGLCELPYHLMFPRRDPTDHPPLVFSLCVGCTDGIVDPGSDWAANTKQQWPDSDTPSLDDDAMALLPDQSVGTRLLSLRHADMDCVLHNVRTFANNIVSETQQAIGRHELRITAIQDQPVGSLIGPSTIGLGDRAQTCIAELLDLQEQVRILQSELGRETDLLAMCDAALNRLSSDDATPLATLATTLDSEYWTGEEGRIDQPSTFFLPNFVLISQVDSDESSEDAQSPARAPSSTLRNTGLRDADRSPRVVRLQAKCGSTDAVGPNSGSDRVGLNSGRAVWQYLLQGDSTQFNDCLWCALSNASGLYVATLEELVDHVPGVDKDPMSNILDRGLPVATIQLIGKAVDPSFATTERATIIEENISKKLPTLKYGDLIITGAILSGKFHHTAIACIERGKRWRVIDGGASEDTEYSWAVCNSESDVVDRARGNLSRVFDIVCSSSLQRYVDTCVNEEGMTISVLPSGWPTGHHAASKSEYLSKFTSPIKYGPSRC